MEVRKSAVRTVFIKVKKKHFGIIILYMQVRKSAVRIVFIKVEKNILV